MEEIQIEEELQLLSTRKIEKNAKDNALEHHEQKELVRRIKSLTNKKQIHKDKFLTLIYLIMESGMRVTEAIQCRLDWFNETEDGVTITIPKQDKDVLNLRKQWIPKTNTSARTVIFINEAVGQSVYGFFKANLKGLQFTRQRAFQLIKEAGALINKEKLHPHALRSTYANNLLYAGCDTNTLLYYMGWSSVTTFRNYVKSSENFARKDLLDKMRGKVK